MYRAITAKNGYFQILILICHFLILKTVFNDKTQKNDFKGQLNVSERVNS